MHQKNISLNINTVPTDTHHDAKLIPSELLIDKTNTLKSCQGLSGTADHLALLKLLDESYWLILRAVSRLDPKKAVMYFRVTLKFARLIAKVDESQLLQLFSSPMPSFHPRYYESVIQKCLEQSEYQDLIAMQKSIQALNDFPAKPE